MRGSGVVQSLKSLVSKLHPQLPLSPKESQRLLTALTSSFRKQLDEAHPRKAQDEGVRPKLDRAAPLRPGRDELHTSSVLFADSHLASVLTNPLLAKPTADEKPAAVYEKAKLELEQNHDQDPILLLEKYHERGTATLALADLCLRTFLASLLELSKAERQQKVANGKAGLRTLRWLWRSGLYASDSFVEDRKFMGALRTMIIEEGEEQLLWDWLRIDLRHSAHSMRTELASQAPDRVFRWKGYMLRLMILARLDQEHPASMNDVLDSYFKAVDIHLELRPQFPHNHLPLAVSSTAINRHLFMLRHNSKAWDAEKYDKYVSTQHLTDSFAEWADFKVALLQLTHPKRPSALPLYDCLKASAGAEPGSRQAQVWRSFSVSREDQRKRSSIRQKHYIVLVETARMLQRQGHREEAEWLVSEIRNLFPEQKHWVDRNLQQGMGPAPAPPQPSHPLDSQKRDIVPPFAIT